MNIPPRRDDLRRELNDHLELEAEAQQDAGLAPADARRAARLALGNPTVIREEVNSMSPWTWWERTSQDLRYGLRGLVRNPAFTLAAVVSLALGIGANTAIFSVMNAVMLRPLPVARPGELATLTNGNIGNYSYPAYRALRDNNRSFTDLIAASSTQRYPAGTGADLAQASVKMVSDNYFSGLGVGAAAGRVLNANEDLEPVAVISYGYWQRQFNGAANAVGQLVRVNGVPFTVVGVAQETFSSEAPGEAPDIWTTFALQNPNSRDERGFTWLYLIGRLRSGITLEQARADLDAVTAQFQPNPGNDAPLKATIIAPGSRGSEGLRSRISAPVLALMAVSGLVLLIACTNLGGLLLTRDAAREQEIAMRLAIGATAPRVVRQLMTESLLLAVLGAAAGLGFAYWASRALVTLVTSAGLDIALDLAIDRRVLGFTAAIAVGAAILFGLAPALRAVRGSRGLIQGTRATGPQRRWGVRASFVVGQIALSLVMLATATMFVRTLRNLETQDLGFALDNRLIVGLMRERGYRPEMATLIPQLLERVGAVPGVAKVSVAAFGTLSENGGGVNGIAVAGFEPSDPQDRRARANWVGPDYFAATNIPLVAGRDLLATDNAAAQKVAVINETAARHFFRDRNALGGRLTFNKNEYEIVGIARDVRLSLRDATPRIIYFAMAQGGSPFSVLEIRTSRPDATAVAPAVRAAIAEVEPRLSMAEAATAATQVERRASVERLVAQLSAFLSGLTVLLVSVGIYGTLAFTASRRTREIGLRLALGSTRSTVIRIVLRDVAALLAVGLAVGSLGVYALGSLLGSLLYRVAPLDPVTLAIAAGVLLSVAIIAAALPAIRASRLDPAKVLRES